MPVWSTLVFAVLNGVQGLRRCGPRGRPRGRDEGGEIGAVLVVPWARHGRHASPRGGQAQGPTADGSRANWRRTWPQARAGWGAPDRWAAIPSPWGAVADYRLNGLGWGVGVRCGPHCEGRGGGRARWRGIEASCTNARGVYVRCARSIGRRCATAYSKRIGHHRAGRASRDSCRWTAKGAEERGKVSGREKGESAATKPRGGAGRCRRASRGRDAWKLQPIFWGLGQGPQARGAALRLSSWRQGACQGKDGACCVFRGGEGT